MAIGSLENDGHDISNIQSSNKITVPTLNQYMTETFKGESKIIERLKAEAVKASDKLIAAQLTMDAMQKRLNAFGLEMDLKTGEIFRNGGTVDNEIKTKA